MSVSNKTIRSIADVSLAVSVTEPESAQSKNRKRCEFGARTRYIVLLLVTLCLSSLWSNILTFNLSIICMGPNNSTSLVSSIAHANANESFFDHRIAQDFERASRDERVNEADKAPTPSTENESHIVSVIDSDYYFSITDETDYTPTADEKSMLIGAVAVGALIAIMPITYLINRLGPRLVFTGVGLLSTIATALIPTAVRSGFFYFLLLRGLQGVSYAACMPMVGVVTARWATLKQNGIYLSILTGYIQIAPTMTMPVSGALCVSSYGWSFIYYIHACWTLICFIIFVLFYRNSPQKHPFVGEIELKILALGKVQIITATKKAQKAVPYAAIFKTASVWAVWLAAVGNFSGTNLVALFSPTYLNKTIGFPVESTGFSAALPPLVQLLVKLFSGLTSDKVGSSL